MGFSEYIKQVVGRVFKGSKVECVCTTTDFVDAGTVTFTVRKKCFPKPKGYRVHTAEGGKFYCRSQADVAVTLSTLYGKTITRDNVHSAMLNFGGLLVVDNVYIAKIKYKKGESK